MNQENHFLKSMDYCQENIKRMASNSFNLKAWFLVIFTALFTFFAQSTKDGSHNITLVDLIWLLPMLSFPYLDAFYLKHERIFIGVFNDFAKAINNQNGRNPFDLRPTKQQLEKFNILNIIFSTSIGWFYFPLLIVFQGLIIYRSLECFYRYLLILIFPLTLVLLALMLRKKTAHQKGI